MTEVGAVRWKGRPFAQIILLGQRKGLIEDWNAKDVVQVRLLGSVALVISSPRATTES